MGFKGVSKIILLKLKKTTEIIAHRFNITKKADLYLF